ncbi:MAG TPA: hypothetical protein VEC37_17015 [Bacillota bacterium]|nr:hypothetical protein [Bacillota bacterium]
MISKLALQPRRKFAGNINENCVFKTSCESFPAQSLKTFIGVKWSYVINGGSATR